MEPLMPFKYVIISPEDTSMKEGCIISEFNQCGLFLCQKGQAEILLGGRPYQINKRNLFIYTAANLLQIFRVSYFVYYWYDIIQVDLYHDSFQVCASLAYL